jgi:glucose/mannose transport system substrate-binding protein
MKTWKLAAGLMLTVALPQAGFATDLEITHWWTSGGEAAAVAELAKAFDASGDKWIDGAIAGGGDTARPVMISRITGGDPMGATQFNHGQQAMELVEAGLMLDLTDVAEANDWKNKIYPPSLLDACTVDGKVYCAPVNIHSPEWLWLSNKVYEDLGIPVPKDWNEFVATAPQVEAAGKIPLALGNQPWQSNLPSAQSARWRAGTWKAVNIDKTWRAAGPDGQSLRRCRCAQAGREIHRARLESGHQHGHHRRSCRPDHGRLGAGRIRRGWQGGWHRLHLPSGSGHERLPVHWWRRFLLPETG